METLKTTELVQNEPDMSKVPGGWKPETDLKLDESFGSMPVRRLLDDTLKAIVFDNVLSPTDSTKLRELFLNSHIAAPVSIQGRQDVPDDRIGSVRATAWSPYLADQLWNRLKTNEFFTWPWHIMSDTIATDWWQDGPYRKWVPVGVSPMLRFMKYEKDGQHYAHYDAGYIYPDPHYRTLKSIVIYLTTNEDSGSTRFIKDGQEKLAVWDRDHRDWTRETAEEEILAKSYPKEGSILVFNHRLCHDVETFKGPGDRIIIRGDIIYKAV